MTFKLNKCRIRKEPLGVILVMGPWNFPVWCSLCPALNAIAAGNTVILKVFTSRTLTYTDILPLALGTRPTYLRCPRKFSPQILPS